MKIDQSIENAILEALGKNPFDYDLLYSVWDEENVKRFAQKRFNVSIATHRAKQLLTRALNKRAFYTIYNSKNFKDFLKSVDKKSVYCFYKILGMYTPPAPRKRKNHISLIPVSNAPYFHHGFFYFGRDSEILTYGYETNRQKSVTANEWFNNLSACINEFPQREYFILPYQLKTAEAIHKLTNKTNFPKFILLPNSVFFQIIPNKLHEIITRMFSNITPYNKQQKVEKYSSSSTGPFAFNVNTHKAMFNRLETLVKSVVQA